MGGDDIAASPAREVLDDPGIGIGDDKDGDGRGKGEEDGKVGMGREGCIGLGRTI